MSITTIPVDQPTPGVRFQPAVGSDLVRGISQIVAAVRPTLGPLPRLVAVAPAGCGAPELLDSGAIIARRIVALPDPAANTGAMLARALIWQMHEATGDGTVTAAVIYEAAVKGCLPFLATGGDPWRVRAALARHGEQLSAAVLAQASPIRGKAALSRMAQHAGHDHELAPLLGEIVDIVGSDGQIDVHAAPGRTSDREYAEGRHWPSGVASAQFITDHTSRRVTVANGGLLITDFDLTRDDMAVIIAQGRAAGLPGLVVLAQRVADGAIGLLRDAGIPAFAAKLPGAGETGRLVAMRDLLTLTGGAFFTRAAGDTVARVTPTSFGRARLLWADRDRFGLIGGKGDPRALRRQILALREQARRPLAPEVRVRVEQRLAELQSGSVTLRVGGATAAAITSRRDSAARTVRVLQGALRGGVVPGGGATFHQLRPLVEATIDQTDDAERAAGRAVLAALAAPASVILANAGIAPAAALARLTGAPAGHAIDARTGEIVDCAETGLLDVAVVTAAAIRLALAAAGQALTIDTVVTGRQPATATTPLA